ncbi:aspartate kinase [Virgibacillus xinjiangensis]|uniref:Aspartokinase n=1 Tax=Virgibacillus xinjiangensis TaxID=393090 RepID=A0ABV7CRV0_9BACI
MKVAKFGGSSVANAVQLQKVAEIIRSDANRKFVVVSAPGKRYSGDEKVTDILIQLGEAYKHGEEYTHYINKVMGRFKEIIEDLELSENILEDIRRTIEKVLEKDTSIELKLDSLKAVGEDSSAKILSGYLASLGENASYINPEEAGIIVSNEPGNAHILDESFSKIYSLREKDGIFVIPGFFGYTTEGELITFSRGGSDITGAIVAAGVQAELYENFTDVDSVYTVNPTLVDNPKEITTLTYREMRELSYAGFSVFHDEALIPAFEKGIPVCIKNTNNPHAPGTNIVAEKKESDKCVVGIASDTGFCSIYISKFLMNREVGFGRKLFQILEDEEVSFEHAPSGIDDMSIIIRESLLTPEKEKRVLDRMKNELKPEKIDIHRDLAMIMVVGEGLVSTIGIAQRATTAISSANVNIEMINQGSSEVSMMFGIESEGLQRGLQSLYTAFFE